jgi:hypothetical protein
MAGFYWQLSAAAAAAGDGTTVSAANSGTEGPTSVNTVAGGTLAYDDDLASHPWVVNLATGATSGTSNMVWGVTRVADWTPSAWFSWKIRFTSLAANRSICRTRGGGTQILRLHHTSDGRLELRDSGNSVSATGTDSMPTDTDLRIEIRSTPGAASECVARWYLGNSRTIEDEVGVGVTDNYSSGTDTDELTLGNIAAGANIPSYYIWEVRGSNVDWLGPLPSNITVIPPRPRLSALIQM